MKSNRTRKCRKKNLGKATQKATNAGSEKGKENSQSEQITAFYGVFIPSVLPVWFKFAIALLKSINQNYNSMKLICKMCGCNKVTKRKFIGIIKQNSGKEIDFQICERCHFHYAPDNFYQYVETHNYGYSPRIGTDKKAGREYHLANFAYNLYTQVNDKECPSVLFLGVGESKDHDRIRAENKFSKSKITDIINYQNSEHHIPLDSPEKFNAIIISEVIEHFVEPREDFDGIFSKLEDDGILVITVNIHDQKSKIEYLSYPFIGGHTCYYTGESLYAMAEALGYSLDFRNLFGSQGYLGPRKKTLIFYKNPNYQKAIGLYFSKNWQVPSEFGNLKGN